MPPKSVSVTHSWGCGMLVGTSPDASHPAVGVTHVFLALLKEQALFRGSGAWSAGVTFRWQVM